MHPPLHIVQKLKEIEPTLRLAWWAADVGGKDQTDDELNRGCFAIVQLYRKRDQEKTMYTPWADVGGPIFGDRYDPLLWEPFLMDSVSKENLFNSEIISQVREALKPMKERYIESALTRGAQEHDLVRDIGGEQGQYLWHKHKKADNANTTASKFAPKYTPRDISWRKEHYLKRIQNKNKGFG